MTVSPTFVVMLKPMPGTDGIKALRATLKVALRRFGMRCIDAHEIPEAMATDLTTHVVGIGGDLVTEEEQ
jgi:hypothetical protein